MRIFFLTAILGGLGAAAGSILDFRLEMEGVFYSGGKGLYAGAVLGGMLAVAFAVWIAEKMAWFDRRNFRPALLGGEIGLLVAAPVVMQMLSTVHLDRIPIGPILSTVLIGAGALVGSRVDKGGYENGVNPRV